VKFAGSLWLRLFFEVRMQPKMRSVAISLFSLLSFSALTWALPFWLEDPKRSNIHDPQGGAVTNPTATLLPTLTRTVTPTVSPTWTNSPDVTATISPTVTDTATSTHTVTPTYSATNTPLPTDVSCHTGAAITVDGNLNEAVWAGLPWNNISSTQCNYYTLCGISNTAASARYKLVMNNTALYIGIEVSNTAAMYPNAIDPWNGEGVEIFFDRYNHKPALNPGPDQYNDPAAYQWVIASDLSVKKQYRSSVTAENNAPATRISAASVVTAGTGYVMEIAIPWANVGNADVPAADSLSGLNIAVNLSEQGLNTADPPVLEIRREHAIASYNWNSNPYDRDPSLWGTLKYLTCVP
jgi:hypothetical protein